MTALQEAAGREEGQRGGGAQSESVCGTLCVCIGSRSPTRSMTSVSLSALVNDSLFHSRLSAHVTPFDLRSAIKGRAERSTWLGGSIKYHNKYSPQITVEIEEREKMALCRGRDRPCRAQPPDGHAASRYRRPRHYLPWFDAWDTLAATRRDRWLELTGRQIAFRDAVRRRWCVTVSVARDAPRQKET